MYTSREARGYLNKAIESGKYTDSVESYIETINEMHRISYAGTDGTHEWYSSAGNGHLDVNPGQIRTGGGLSNHRIKSAQQAEQIAQKYGDPFKVDDISRVELDGISKNNRPINSHGEHRYPAGDNLREYFVQMQRTAKEALELINNGASQREILEKIAEHYQYAANARPYGQINNSLFMNEVNTLLKKAGMNPMPQGNLDTVSMYLQPDAFKKYFVDQYYATHL